MRRFCVVFSSAFPSIKHVWRTPSPPRLAHGLSTSDHMTLFIHIGGKERCELQTNHDYDDDDDDVMKKKLNNFLLVLFETMRNQECFRCLTTGSPLLSGILRRLQCCQWRLGQMSLLDIFPHLPIGGICKRKYNFILNPKFFFFTIESRLNRTIIKALVQTIECFSYSLYKYQFSNEHLLCMTLHCQ